MDADDDDNRHQLGPHAHDDEDADPNLPHHDEEGNEEDEEEEEEEEEEDDSLSDDEDENEEDRDDLLHQSHGSPNPDDDEEEEADDDDDNEISTPDTNTAAPLVVLNHSHHHRHPGNDGRNGADDVAAVGLVTPAAAAATMTPSRSAAVKRSVADASPGGGGARAGTTTTTTTGSKRLKVTDDEDAGTPEEQAEFLNEVETFYRERSLEFKAPKFYGEPLNCLKLWNAVVRLGGYDRVTACKLWRQVGESFHPPKTCTTVSWTFRIFYEKALLEYEKHKRQIGELEFPGLPLTEPTAVENEGSGSQNTGSGRARRDAAARAMQGWHAQRLIGFGEVGEPIIKDKSLGASQKREKQLKSIGVNKLKKPSNLELAENDLHTESTKQLLTTVVDVGPPADWVKVSVRESKDCFEVYALVPGLLREEVRVQSDPAGRIVITGQPEQLENPWGITPFKKIVNLPARINPLQTSAVVSLHGRLFVRVPFERSSS